MRQREALATSESSVEKIGSLKVGWVGLGACGLLEADAAYVVAESEAGLEGGAARLRKRARARGPTR